MLIGLPILGFPLMPVLSLGIRPPPPRQTREQVKQYLRRLWCEESHLAKFAIESAIAEDPSLRDELFAKDWEPQWTYLQRWYSKRASA